MSANQLVCIKRPDAGLSSVFEEMYINERLVDVTLSCCDGQLQAHKLVLAAYSPYFSNLFDKLVNPFHYPVVVLKDMQFDDLKLMVDFMYRGQLTLTRERLTALMKSAENLQIYGLSYTNGISLDNSMSNSPIGNEATNNLRPSLNHRKKKTKKYQANHSSLSSLVRSYQMRIDEPGDGNINSSPNSDNPMMNGGSTTNASDSLDANHHQFQPYPASNHTDPTSSKNITSAQQRLQTPSPSSMNIQHLSNNSNTTGVELQVLSHSLAANRTSIGGTNNNNNANYQISIGQHSSSRGRVHPCTTCWKTFREKANLKRHLQVHSLNRVVYACSDCHKTFSWKDNFIRHTKTAHHMNNRQSN